MRWEDERYVRLYTRDTVDWLFLSFEAQGLLALLLRKMDRAGILRLGKHGLRGLAAILGHPSRAETLDKALQELLADGCVEVRGDALIFPNFIEAQETAASDAQRKRDERERAQAKARAAEVLAVTNRDQPSQNVTNGHETGQKVTSGHAASRAVTPNQPTLPNQPCLPNQKGRAVDQDVANPTATSTPLLREQMDAVWSAERNGTAFDWNTREQNDLRTLMGKYPEAEIVKRWRIGLRMKFPKAKRIGHLVEHWNAYAAEDDTGPPNRVKDLRTGRVAAEDVNPAAFEKTGAIHDF